MQTNFMLAAFIVFFIFLILSGVFSSVDFASRIAKYNKLPMKKGFFSSIIYKIMHKEEYLKTQKGFTIIELIVVIAIIAVLAAIVLVNVTQYIAKGKDASIKGNMSSMATISAAYYDNNSSNFLAGGSTATELNDAAWKAGVVAINDANGPVNNVTSNVISSAWCIQSTLNGGGSWCVDSSGYKGSTANCDASNANCK